MALRSEGTPAQRGIERRSGAREQASFWAAAGLALGAWLTAALALFFLLVFLSSPPPPPPPGPLSRAAVLEALSAALRAPSEERYTRVAQAARALQRDPRCPEALSAELEEAARLAELLAASAEYLLLPVWVELPPSRELPESGALPLLLVETAEDALWSGTKGVLVSEAERRVILSSERELSIRWRAGDPLRLRFSVQQGFWGSAPFVLGGDDLERAPDAPLPDASLLLLGEPRALTRGGGRYLVRVRLAREGPPLVVPPLLAEAAAYPGRAGEEPRK